jgi:hypothetical protein
LTEEKKRNYGLVLLKLRKEYQRKTGNIPAALSYQSIANKVGVWFVWLSLETMK